jgi:peptide/nickel transport system substrate-binding protein
MLRDPFVEIHRHGLRRARAGNASRGPVARAKVQKRMAKSIRALGEKRRSLPARVVAGVAARLASTRRRCAWWLCGCLIACANGPSSREPGVLSVVLPRDVQELDPRFVSDVYGHKISRLIFASLMRIEPQTLEAVPDLAETVDVISDVEYRVRLREGLRFSDGSVLDATDVVATYRSVVDPVLRTRYAPTYARIAQVEALDSQRVVFRLNGPHATFITDLELPILRAEDAHRRVALVGGPAPVGAGPYVLALRQPGRIDLRANPHWYGGKPRVPRVDMLVVRDDNTRALRLLAGAADLALNAIPPGLVPLFTHNARFEVESAPGIGTTYLGINTRAPALRDERVRRALAYAIDRAALIATKFSGRAESASSFVPPGHWAYAADTPSYPHDLGRARALLDQAGLSAVAGTPRLELRLRCGSDRFRVSIARAIAAMLGEVGVAVSVQPTEMATLIADLDRGRFEVTLLQMPEVIEPHVLSWFFASDRIPGSGREGANRWRFASAELDAAFERGRRNLDRAQRRAAYADVQRILAQQLPVIPLWHEAVVAVRSVAAPRVAVPRDGRFSTLAR